MKEEALIGGEFWYDSAFIKDGASELPGYFLGGGQSSLYVACEYLKQLGINRILLPDYLCPTILDRIDKQNIGYEFYNINDDFSVDLDSLERKMNSFKAVLFINYFGLSTSRTELDYFKALKERGIIVIEDKVHTLDNNYMGDFAFNSFRKFVPYSGSILYTELDVRGIIEKLPLNVEYFKAVRNARDKKTRYVNSTTKVDCEYLAAFKAAEESYYHTASRGDGSEKEMVSKLDIEKLERIRRENYLYLLDIFKQTGGIQPVFKDIAGKVPLGFPVYVEAERRDLLRNQLKNENIFLPVHWNLRDEKRIDSVRAKEISDKILTIVVDQRYTKKDMNFLAEKILGLLG